MSFGLRRGEAEWRGAGREDCYCFLLSQQTGADSRMAFLSVGSPQIHQSQSQRRQRRKEL